MDLTLPLASEYADEDNKMSVEHILDMNTLPDLELDAEAESAVTDSVNALRQANLGDVDSTVIDAINSVRQGGFADILKQIEDGDFSNVPIEFLKGLAELQRGGVSRRDLVKGSAQLTGAAAGMRSEERGKAAQARLQNEQNAVMSQLGVDQLELQGKNLQMRQEQAAIQGEQQLEQERFRMRQQEAQANMQLDNMETTQDLQIVQQQTEGIIKALTGLAQGVGAGMEAYAGSQKPKPVGDFSRGTSGMMPNTGGLNAPAPALAPVSAGLDYSITGNMPSPGRLQIPTSYAPTQPANTGYFSKASNPYEGQVIDLGSSYFTRGF